MKKILLILFVSIACHGFSQDFIVKTAGDTLKCKITHITNFGIQYKIPSQVYKKNWIAYSKPVMLLETKQFIFIKSFRRHGSLFTVTFINEKTVMVTRVRGFLLFDRKHHKYVQK